MFTQRGSPMPPPEALARAFYEPLSTGDTHHGELFGIPPTGKPIEAMAIDFHRIESDQIAETWHVEDYRTVFAQLGVVCTLAS